MMAPAGTSESFSGRPASGPGSGRFALSVPVVDCAGARAGVSIFWLRDGSLEDSASLPDPHVLAEEIAEDLRSALAQIEDVLGDLRDRQSAQ